jgi:hypothetical protein
MPMNKPVHNSISKTSGTPAGVSKLGAGRKKDVESQIAKENTAFNEWMKTEKEFERFNSRGNPFYKTLPLDSYAGWIYEVQENFRWRLDEEVSDSEMELLFPDTKRGLGGLHFFFWDVRVNGKKATRRALAATA